MGLNGTAGAAFVANAFSASLPGGTITFAHNPHWTAYLALFPAVSLPSGGGTDALTGTDLWNDGPGGDDCPGCGVVVAGQGATLVGVNLPEPTAAISPGAFASILGAVMFLRRKRVQQAELK